MSIARTLGFNKTSIRILTAILLIGLLPGVSAYCYTDYTGYEYCDGTSILSTGAIAGIVIGGILSFITICLLVWLCLRRRPVTQTNVVYPPTTQAAYYPPAQPAPAMMYGSPYTGGQLPYAPQYPPPGTTKGASPYGYDPSPGYAQGAVPPTSPQQYAHPASP